MAFGGADRDGTRHPRPDTFDLTRPPVRHLAFGRGVRSCPGSQLAREQLNLTLQELTGRLPGLRLAEGQPVAMDPPLAPGRLHLTW
ncbi:cytochrome P450 [Streptomyces sp. LUP47B]|uniref:cytochrome P450 n=1 Tax=Streptomyces sp. LUP47B TaxID=1890286 RepID=UPI003520F5E7